MRITACLSLILFFCICPYTGAQQDFRQEFAAGGSFGASFSSVSFTPRVQQNMLLTFNAGITGRWISEKHCGIQVELNYAQFGWDEEFEDTQYYYTRRINSVELPFLSHFYVGNKNFRVYLNIGPKISYAFGESTSANTDEYDDYPPNRSTIQRNMPVEKKFGWGICGGPGMELRTGIGIFQVEGRYFYSLGDIYNSRRGDDFPKSSPQVISVKLSYLIPVFRR